MEHLLDSSFRRIARLLGEVGYCIVKRRVRRAQLADWAGRLRETADALEKGGVLQ